MANKIGCSKKLRKAFSPGVIVFCGDYNSNDDYIHLCGQCRLEKMNDAYVSGGDE